MAQSDGPAAPPELSVIVLCYREEDYVPEVLASVESAIQQLGVSYEVVLVANYVAGTADRSPQIASAAAGEHPRVTVVAKPKEGMMGWDMRSGLEASTGCILAVMDGDGQISPGDIGRAYRELRARSLDLCQPYRVRREDGWSRLMVSRIYNGIFSLLFPGTGLHDVNAKPKVMTREAYHTLRLRSTDWFIDAEIIIQARRNGLRLGEIPSMFGKGAHRPSFIKAGVMCEFIKNLITARVRETLNRH